MNTQTYKNYDIGPDGRPVVHIDPGPAILYYILTFGIILGISTWVVLTFPTGDSDDFFIIFTAWVNIIWGGLGFCYSLRRTGYSMLTLTYIFFLIFFGLIPFTVFRANRWTFGVMSNSDIPHIRYAMICTQVCMLMTLVGYRFCPKNVRFSCYQWWAKREVVMSRIALALGTQVFFMLVLLYLIGTAGLIASGAESEFVVEKSYALIVGLFVRPMMLFMGLFAWYGSRREGETPGVKLCAWLMLGLGILANLATSTTRFYSIFTVTAILFGVFPVLRRNSSFVMSYIFAGFAASPIAYQFRGLSSISELVQMLKEFRFDQQYVFGGNFDAFEMLTYAVSFVNDKGITWGRQLFGVLLFWAPRSMWENKPVSTGELLGSNYIGISASLSNTNLSSPLSAEGFVNLGIVGVIIIGFVYGCFCIWVDQLAEAPLRPRDTSGLGFASAVFLPGIAALSLIISRGSLMVGFSALCGILAACYCASLFFLSKRV